MTRRDAGPDPASGESRRPEHHEFECRRAFPRVKLQMPVQIGLPGGEVVCARIYNITPDGLQVRCDRATARSIHPGREPPASGQEPELLVVMRLRQDDDVRTHVLRCRVRYMLAESRDEIAMGVDFLTLLPEQQAAIESVVGASLDPTGDAS